MDTLGFEVKNNAYMQVLIENKIADGRNTHYTLKK